LRDGDILAVASKIVALSQGRIETDVRKKVAVIRHESEVAVETPLCHLTLKDGHWCANAGVDESNAENGFILWPNRPFEAAADLRKALVSRFFLKKLGVLITDSRTFPLRAGVTGVSLGHAGFNVLRDYRDRMDLFGRPMKMTQTNVADALASAAVLVSGEGSERTPLALIRKAPVVFTSRRAVAEEMKIDPRLDLYRPFYRALKADRIG
jgi:coenzyme F420-0:L-glutamate ligase